MMRSPLVPFLCALLGLPLAAVACESATLPADVTATNPDGGVTEIEETVPEEEGTTLPDGTGAPDCRLRSVWNGAPSATCSATAAACLDKAKSDAAATACVSSDPNCATCWSDIVRGCLVGTPAKPGPCADKAGCVEGCIATACGDKPTAACRDAAMSNGACKAQASALSECFDQTDKSECVDRFYDECVPSPSCGNKVVEGGEACDGNCPTSCPPAPAGDLCTRNTLTGAAATCSAKCTSQSICPANCPSNPASPSSAVGVIASGAALPTTTRAGWPALSELKTTGCPSITNASSQVIAWKAPAAGAYSFAATCSVQWEEYELGTGRKFTRALECVRRIALARGRQCAAGVAPFACSLDVDNAFKQSQLPDKATLDPIELSAGEEILVAVDFGVAYLPPATTANTYNGSVTATSWSVRASTCVPQCAGKSCGSDGCGGSCGTCPGGRACLPSGQCQAACVPQCAGKSCGSDGCGGSCGFCGAGQTCNAMSLCVSNGACDPVDNVGCPAPQQCMTLSNETTVCQPMGTGGQGAPCANSSSCRGGYGCFAGTCRKICDRLTDDGCAFDETCASVVGWTKLGTCAK